MMRKMVDSEALCNILVQKYINRPQRGNGKSQLNSFMQSIIVAVIENINAMPYTYVDQDKGVIATIRRDSNG